MKALRTCILTALVAAATPVSFAADVPTQKADYVNALTVANSFLVAWSSRDSANGISLLSSRLKHGKDRATEEPYESWLQLYFLGLSNPHHQAFEIKNGRLIAHKRYSFTVTLYEVVDGGPDAFSYTSELEVSFENGAWDVSNLPKSSDNP